MVTNSFYLVNEEVANRSGVRQYRYKTKDGKFILDNNDLFNITLTSEELLHGISGIKEITKKQADKLIKDNDYTIESEK